MSLFFSTTHTPSCTLSPTWQLVSVHSAEARNLSKGLSNWHWNRACDSAAQTSCRMRHNLSSHCIDIGQDLLGICIRHTLHSEVASFHGDSSHVSNAVHVAALQLQGGLLRLHGKLQAQINWEQIPLKTHLYGCDATATGRAVRVEDQALACLQQEDQHITFVLGTSSPETPPKSQSCSAT